MSTWRGEPEPPRWDEAEAVMLLKEAGALVAGYEAEGARMPEELRESYHARIAEAPDARDMSAYREAINGYEESARAAYRRQREVDFF